MKFVSRDDRARLNEARDTKGRIRLSLELAEARLRQAEMLTPLQRYDEASAQLGSYQGLIEDAFRFLQERGKNDDKARDLYKRIELTLRAHSSRIEALRRTTPYEYAGNLKDLLTYLRDARTRALNTFYGDTVLREEPPATGEAATKKPASEPQKTTQP